MHEDYRIRSLGVRVGMLLVLLAMLGATAPLLALGTAETVGGDVVINEASPAPARDVSEVDARDVSVAESLQNAFGAAAAKALPVVVQVNVVEVVRQAATRSMSPFELFGLTPNGQRQREGLGSGVIVGRDGDTVYVLTNYHVAGSATDIQIVLNDERKFDGKLVGGDERMDLALLSFATKEEIPIATLGDSSNLRVGDWVIAVGNPYGFTSSVTAGIVSALHREAVASTGISRFTDYIQTDAAINTGNSGGALLNLRGEVVGINTWIASQTGGSIGIGFAIPINNAKSAIASLVQNGKITYGWLGVSIIDPAAQTMPGLAEDLGVANRQGSFVLNVVKGSPAERGGVLPGDFITRAGTTAIVDTEQLTETVARLAPNTDLPLTIVRQGREQTLNVRITERPDETKLASDAGNWPGLLVLPLSERIRAQLQTGSNQKGVVIADVADDSPSGVAGLRQGDVVLSVNGSAVSSVTDFYRVLNQANGREVALRVQRQGREATITFSK